MTKVTLEVNGKKVTKEVPDHTLLSVFLRDNLNLTGKGRYTADINTNINVNFLIC